MNQESKAHAVNPEMVTLARESRGLTQSDLANLLGISQARLSKIEAGNVPVSVELLDRLSVELGYPNDFFRRTDPIFGPGASEFFHRRRQSVGNKLLSRIHAMVNIRRIEIARLLRAVEIPENNIPRLDPDAFDGSVQEVARAVRAAWQLPRGPIRNLTEVVEEAGGIVIQLDLVTPKVDALSRYIPGLPPLFFMNAAMPGDRQRLSLAHELAHAVMHATPNPEMEDEAFVFASELLMPERDICPAFEHLTLARLAALKPHWGVSMAALLKWAHKLKAVTDNQARYLWAQLSKAGYKKREPAELDVAAERPRTLDQIVELHREHFGYTVHELSKLLSLASQEVERFYGVKPSPNEARAHLRLLRDAVQEA